MNKNIEVRIDYFSVTFPLNCDAEDSVMFRVHEMVKLISTYLHVSNFEIVRLKYAQNNFNYQYILGEHIILRLDGPINASYQRTCHLELKGEGCRDFEKRNKDKNWINFILFMVQLNSTFKRIDIAIDDYKGDKITLGWLLEKVNKKYFTSIFKSKPLPHGTLENGLTIQFGSTTSQIELVIYDKKQERLKRKKECPYDYWVRYEMRFREKNASMVAYKLSNMYVSNNTAIYGTELQKFSYEQLYRIIDFKENNGYSEANQKKAKTDPKWNEFLDNVSKGTLKDPNQDKLPKTFEAYLKSAIPYTSMLLLIKYLQVLKNPFLFELEIIKFLNDNLTFSKQRFQKLNIYLDQLSLKTIDDDELSNLKKEFAGIIMEKELPF